MEIFVLVIIIIILLALLLAFAYPRSDFLSLAQRPIIGSAENSDLICEKTSKKLKSFLNAEFTDKRIVKSAELLEDIEQTIDLTEKKVKNMNIDTLNIKTAKLILDAMLHYHIYENHPNNISKTVLNDHIKKLGMTLKRNICFDNQQIKELISKIKEIIKLYSHKEIKITSTQFPEYFRKSKLAEFVNIPPDCDTLRDELSKKNIELRECREKTITSAFTGISLLDSCERDRRALQEKVSELRRDLENAKNSTPAELQVLRDRLEECQKQNAVLGSDLDKSKKEHENQSAEITRLAKELDDCHMIVNTLSTEPV